MIALVKFWRDGFSTLYEAPAIAYTMPILFIEALTSELGLQCWCRTLYPLVWNAGLLKGPSNAHCPYKLNTFWDSIFAREAVQCHTFSLSATRMTLLGIYCRWTKYNEPFREFLLGTFSSHLAVLRTCACNFGVYILKFISKIMKF